VSSGRGLRVDATLAEVRGAPGAVNHPDRAGLLLAPVLAAAMPIMTTAAWSAFVTGLGGALALMIPWVEARVPDFSWLRVSSVPVPRDRGAEPGGSRP
jgi:hypothetical protein